MSAIDELCQLLDERNEEYDIRDNSGGTPSYVMVCWFFNLADRAYFYGYPDGHTKLVTYRYDHDLTPEQAIAATLGTGTCELVNAADDLGDGTSSCMCDKCGYTALDDWWDEFNFCPNCGSRLEEDA